VSIADFPQIQRLTDPEKVDLIVEIWNSLQGPPRGSQTEEELFALLEERWAHHLAHPDEALTIEQFKQLVETRRSEQRNAC
jgi:putative addiction module component (TIGR02574 family)